MRTHSALSPAEHEIVDHYRNEWRPHLRMLLNALLGNDQAVDLRQLALQQVERLAHSSTFRMRMMSPASFRRIQRILTLPLPRELFVLDGTSVSLKAENRDFIVRFFGAMGELTHRGSEDEA